MPCQQAAHSAPWVSTAPPQARQRGGSRASSAIRPAPTRRRRVSASQRGGAVSSGSMAPSLAAGDRPVHSPPS